MPRRQLLIVGLIACVTFLTGLGTPGLWDQDEGFFASTALEMHQRGEWIVPYFNGEIFSHKPPFMFWMMRLGFFLLGENEWGARFFSAVFGGATALLTALLGRRLFGGSAGLWAGLAMSSCIMFGVVARAATPDAYLVFFTTLAIYLYVRSVGDQWPAVGDRFRRTGGPAEKSGCPPFLLPQRPMQYVGIYAAMALAVLVKGPIGVLLPGVTIGLFVILAAAPASSVAGRRVGFPAWARQFLSLVPFQVFWRMRPWTALAVVLLVAGPWYAAVGLRTQGQFLQEFFGVHHVGRFLQPMERHGGTLAYYFPSSLIGFFPWSAFWLPVCLYGLAALKQEGPRSRPWLLLTCWVTVVIGFFSLASTKLPNYILPVYPAFALGTGAWIEAWRKREAGTWHAWPQWAYGSLVVVGGGISFGFLALTRVHWEGRLLLSHLNVHESIGGEGIPIAVLGLLLLAGGCVSFRFTRRDAVDRSLTAFVATAVLFCTGLLAFEAARLDRYQFNRPVVGGMERPPEAADRRPLFGAFRSFQPSLVFYAKRGVPVLRTEEQLDLFMREFPGVPILVDDRGLQFLREEMHRSPHVLRTHAQFPKPGMLHVVGSAAPDSGGNRVQSAERRSNEEGERERGGEMRR